MSSEQAREMYDKALYIALHSGKKVISLATSGEIAIYHPQNSYSLVVFDDHDNIVLSAHTDTGSIQVFTEGDRWINHINSEYRRLKQLEIDKLNQAGRGQQ